MIFECQKHDVPNKDCPSCFAASQPLTGEEQAQVRFELRGLRKQLTTLITALDQIVEEAGNRWTVYDPAVQLKTANATIHKVGELASDAIRRHCGLEEEKEKP